MTDLNYHARAELYLGSDWQTAAAQGARTFATAAQAIRFALEEAAPVSLRGAKLIIGEASFDREDLAAFYQSADFPLPRKGDVKRSRARRPLHQRGGALTARLRSAAQRATATA